MKKILSLLLVIGLMATGFTVFAEETATVADDSVMEIAEEIGTAVGETAANTVESIAEKEKALEAMKEAIEKAAEELGEVATDVVTMAEPTYLTNSATVVGYDAENNKLSVKLDSEDGGRDMELIVSQNTVIYDNVNKTVVAIEDLKADDVVVVVYSPATTFSIPPQSSVFAVFTNVESGVGTYFIDVANVIVDEENVTITDASGEYEVVMPKMTDVTPYLTKQIVKAIDIAVGDKLVVSADLVSASIPAVINPTNVIYVKGEVPVETEPTVVEKFSEVMAEKGLTYLVIDDVTYVPIRVIAENLGYTVDWDNDTQGVMLTKENRSYTMNIDSDIYGVNKAIAKFSMPKLIQGSTYVPVEFIEEIMQ